MNIVLHRLLQKINKSVYVQGNSIMQTSSLHRVPGPGLIHTGSVGSPRVSLALKHWMERRNLE